jgi:hypothetical protein
MSALEVTDLSTLGETILGETMLKEGGPGFTTTREVGLQINILEVADLNTVQLTHGERPYGRKVWALRQV